LKKTKTQPGAVCAAATLVFLGALSAKAASITYQVNFDTSSVSGTAGFLDFQFNPGNNTSFAATAQINGFSPDGGSLSGAPSISGDVTGTLPGTVTFVNDTALNELFQGFNFGSSFSFQLMLSGAGIGAPNVGATAGSIFGIGIYDNGQNPVLTDQGATTGFAAEVFLNTDGTVSTTSFPAAPGAGSSAASFSPVLVPEPGTIGLLGVGLAGVVLLIRRPA